MTLEKKIHALERIWLRLVLAELQDPEMEQTGSARELVEGRKRCSEYVLKWGHSELTFPICSAHALLGFVSLKDFPDRCQRRV